MGAYLEKLSADIKVAMRARDKPRLTLLRMLVAGIQEEQHRSGKEELSDDAEQQVLQRAVKTRRESVKQAEEVGRQEIADAEAAEIVVIAEYLPKQMTGDELLAKIREVAAATGYTGPKDTGTFMKAWQAQYKGLADGRAMQEALKSL